MPPPQLRRGGHERVEGPVNVASSEPVSIAALARMIADELGRAGLLRFGSEPALLPGKALSVCRHPPVARTKPAWTPRYGPEAGLRHTINWLETQPARATGARIVKEERR